MTKDEILDRVRKLIMLSTSPYEEEARTSAKMACDLILEHGLTVSHHVLLPPPPPPGPAPPSSTPADGVRIRSKYSGFCKRCGKEFDVGDPIVWKKGAGVWHPSCWRQHHHG